MQNIFVGKSSDKILFKLTPVAKIEIERLAAESEMSVTDFILFLVDAEGRKREIEKISSRK